VDTVANNNNNNINNNNNVGTNYQVYGTARKINHLLYMDDLKLIGRSEEELGNEIKIVKKISDDIKMKFGSEKCARISLKMEQFVENSI
jgi:hypothetical protein